MVKRWQRLLEVSPGEKTPRPCGDEALLSGRGPSQMGWYAFVAEIARGQSVLDVGCGSGEGLKLLSATASHALGIDLDARLHRPDVSVEIKSVSDVPDKSFDVVVCLDVIEHVEGDRAFLDELFRVARKAVFVTTPNYAMTFNRNPYHVREYTPWQFARLFEGRGTATIFSGTAKGREINQMRRPFSYGLIGGMYRWKPTLLLAKALKRILRVKVWGHQAALVHLEAEPSKRFEAAA